jgi:hypothetical protein
VGFRILNNWILKVHYRGAKPAEGHYIMAHIVIAAFPNPQDAVAAQGELQEAGARQEDFLVLAQTTVDNPGDRIEVTLLAVGLPKQAISPYATTIGKGGMARSVKDNTLSNEEVAPCFQRHQATVVNLITTIG